MPLLRQRHLFSARGATFTVSWGSVQGFVEIQNPQALKAQFTIGLARFKKNIVGCCAGTALISTSVVWGLSTSQRDESRFSALFHGNRTPGATPSSSEIAPLALNTYGRRGEGDR